MSRPRCTCFASMLEEHEPTCPAASTDTPKLDPPPDAAWINWRGRRWATDGYCVVRDDCPPAKYALSWRVDVTASDLDRFVGARPASLGRAPDVNGWVKPLVRAAAGVAWGGPTDPIWLLDENDELLAAIAPAVNGAGRVDEMFARTHPVTDSQIVAALTLLDPGAPISLHRAIPRGGRLPRWTLHVGGTVVAAGPLARCVAYLLRETRSSRASADPSPETER